MKMTLLGHFMELKKRIVWSLLVFCAAFAAGLWLAPRLQSFVAAPLLDLPDAPAMIMTGIADGLSVEFSLAGLFALAAAFPFFLWQMWLFAAPALKKGERRIAAPLLVLSPVLFLAGAAFAYYFLLPAMFRFFIGMSGAAVLAPNLKSYLSFSIDMLAAFGLAFQLPLILALLNRAGIFSRGQIWRAGRYIIVGIFVVAAILTPPDIISQVALALPLAALFALSFLFMI
jgi:sec-independent protein translocase protein TatC